MHEYPLLSGSGNPAGEKGQAAEVSVLPEYGCWDAGKYPADCHIMWSAIIQGIQRWLLSVNVGVSPGFTDFLLREN